MISGKKEVNLLAQIHSILKAKFGDDPFLKLHDDHAHIPVNFTDNSEILLVKAFTAKQLLISFSNTKMECFLF